MGVSQLSEAEPERLLEKKVVEKKLTLANYTHHGHRLQMQEWNFHVKLTRIPKMPLILFKNQLS
jgi:hypothetical protein